MGENEYLDPNKARTMNETKARVILGDWIRENLTINCDLDDKSGLGNSVHIGLRIKGEKEDFTSEYIHIPETS